MTPTRHATNDGISTLDRTDEWADLHALLAAGLRYPDDELRAHLAAGDIDVEVERLADRLRLPPETVPDRPTHADGNLGEAYAALFEAMQTPYAPPAESPYKPWYGDREGGLMEGPPASAMEVQYRAMGATVPARYPADHLALQLEYGSYLLETGECERYRTFVAEHYDWVPAFRQLVEDAAADAPFHRWVVALTGRILGTVRDRLDIVEPGEETVARMLDRVDPSGRHRG